MSNREKIAKAMSNLMIPELNSVQWRIKGLSDDGALRFASMIQAETFRAQAQIEDRAFPAPYVFTDEELRVCLESIDNRDRKIVRSFLNDLDDLESL